MRRADDRAGARSQEQPARGCDLEEFAAPGLPLGGLWRVTHGVLDSLFRRLYALVVGGAR